MARNTFRFEPWHALALGGGILGIALISRLGGAGPRIRFIGPAEGYSPLEDESLCAPSEPRGTRAFANFVMKNFGGGDYGIARDCGGGLSGHTSGRAWDWNTTIGRPQVNALLEWLFANNDEVIRRAGITYLIWNGRIWNTRSRTWQAYTGPNPHTDHVHFSFSTPGSQGQTSFYRSLAGSA